MKISAIVCTLAAQIRKANPDFFDMRESMKMAWSLVKRAGDAAVLTFKKKNSEEITTRVVSQKWYDFQPPVGNGRAAKEGLMLFADLCKSAVNMPCIISTYKENIIRLAA